MYIITWFDIPLPETTHGEGTRERTKNAAERMRAGRRTNTGGKNPMARRIANDGRKGLSYLTNRAERQSFGAA